MKTLVFDVFGDLGHFKKYYTTSSPLSYAFPPPPTIRGMLGAIVGCGKTEYLEVFSHEKSLVAVRLLAPVKKIRLGLNYINTKGNHWFPVRKRNHGPRSPLGVEFVKDASYRFYVTHKDDLVFRELESNVRGGKSVFTLSLGLSELLAGFKFRGVFEFSPAGAARREISSVVPTSLLAEEGVVFEEGKKYFREKLAVEMNSRRIVGRYEDVLFEADGKAIIGHVKQSWKGPNGENITFF